MDLTKQMLTRAQELAIADIIKKPDGSTSKYVILHSLINSDKVLIVDCNRYVLRADGCFANFTHIYNSGVAFICAKWNRITDADKVAICKHISMGINYKLSDQQTIVEALSVSNPDDQMRLLETVVQISSRY